MRFLYYQKMLMLSNAVSEEGDIALTESYQQSLFDGKTSICES